MITGIETPDGLFSANTFGWPEERRPEDPNSVAYAAAKWLHDLLDETA